ncbi:Acb2/Tad1 domain-containing protein [Paraburkholderia bannensis]|uniref:Acb2/Tad1 domain-containing protein n=1 Tax=Paraburkholderia bannensis TaxID=765414 RepID=UPI0004865887|nr:hypothetical protein [Paraburkholderia bannensis]
MDNQHKQIKGYRDLSQEEIDTMNAVKERAAMVGTLVEHLEGISTCDQRWVAIAKTDLQKGFMALVRSIAQPTTF